MSILHYFGKVNTKPKKYEGDLPQYTGYVFKDSVKSVFSLPHIMLEWFDNKSVCKGICQNKGGIEHCLKPLNIPVELIVNQAGNLIYNDLNIQYVNIHNNQIVMSVNVTDSYISSLSPETYVFSFTTLAETFSKCFEKVREKMYSDLWKTIECCPFINIMDLLLLKQSDTDKHIEHLEQMMCSLMEDNKLLQNRINALETKRAIPVAIPVAVKTVGEELLYESV